MSIIQRLRAYHAVLGILVVAAFLSGEAGVIHAWLGYAIALVIVGRFAAALTGLPALGLSRFYPQFEGLKLGTAFTHSAISKTLLASIAACLIAVTVTGITLDRGNPIGVTAAQADDARRDRGGEERSGTSADGENGPLGEAHEVLSNLLIVLVGLHVTYLLAFKWKLARFMLFLPAFKRRESGEIKRQNIGEARYASPSSSPGTPSGVAHRLAARGRAGRE